MWNFIAMVLGCLFWYCLIKAIWGKKGVNILFFLVFLFIVACIASFIAHIMYG